jgi:hypothetical protein
MATESFGDIRQPRVSDTGHGSGIAIGRRGDLRAALMLSCPDLVFGPAMSYACGGCCINPTLTTGPQILKKTGSGSTVSH